MPTGSLGGRDSRDEDLNIKTVAIVHFLKELQTVAGKEPGEIFAEIRAEGDSSKEGSSRDFSHPVARGGISCVDFTGGDCVEHFKSGHQFIGIVDLEFYRARAGGIDAINQMKEAFSVDGSRRMK